MITQPTANQKHVTTMVVVGGSGGVCVCMYVCVVVVVVVVVCVCGWEGAGGEGGLLGRDERFLLY